MQLKKFRSHGKVEMSFSCITWWDRRRFLRVLFFISHELVGKWNIYVNTGSIIPFYDSLSFLLLKILLLFCVHILIGCQTSESLSILCIAPDLQEIVTCVHASLKIKLATHALAGLEETSSRVGSALWTRRSQPRWLIMSKMHWWSLN